MSQDEEHKKLIQTLTKQLQDMPEVALRENLAFFVHSDGTFRVPYIDEEYIFDYPACTLRSVSGQAELPLYGQLVVLHYLLAAPVAPLTGEEISYRDIPGASFYFGPFSQRSSIPLAKRFGADLESFVRVAEKLGARKKEAGDAGYEFDFLPFVPVTITIWQADEDFAASANITFDKNIIAVFDPEGAAAVGTLLTFYIIGMAIKG